LNGVVATAAGVVLLGSAAGSFAPTTAPVPGYATVSGTIQPLPSLVGLTIHWRMLDSSLRLSNHLATTIAGY
jgi:hypothetical protein